MSTNVLKKCGIASIIFAIITIIAIAIFFTGTKAYADDGGASSSSTGCTGSGGGVCNPTPCSE